MSDTTNTIKQMYWLDGKWVHVDAENANNLDQLDSTDFASNITEKRVDHSNMHLLFGNNDWKQLLYSISDNAIDAVNYNSIHRGMAFTGVNKQLGLTTRIPIDPNAIYLIKVRIKKVSGDGNFSLGVISLDKDYRPMNPYSFAIANNANIATIADLSGKVSGYNLASETSSDKFTNNASYFDIVIVTGQNGSDDKSLFVIESLEILKVQNEMYVGHHQVWHEGNFNPNTKANLTYVNDELAKRDTTINSKLDGTHATVVGTTALGHVKNGGNVTVASDGKISTSPSAIGAYTKAEVDSAIDTDVATHAALIGQTNLGHVKNGGNVTVAPDGKVNTSPTAIGAYTKSETDDLIAVKLTDKVYVDAHIADNVKHVTAAERTKWNAKAEASGSTAKDFSAKNLTVAGNILPTGNSTQDIGSPTNRFRAIYVDEAYLSTNTLYLGDIPILGTEADTVNIKTDPDQSIAMKTSATGTTTVTSEKAVNVTTSGMNGNVTIQATGVNSQTNLAATTAVNVDAPKINLTGTTTIDGDLVARNLNISGNFTVGGTMTTVNAENLVIADNIIDINKGETGQGVSEGMSGIKIDRGDLNDVLLVFDESDDKFKVGDSANLLPLATEKYVYDNRYIHPAGTNPHGTTKADVGLGNVTNESKATMFTNSVFTGKPTAPTAADNDNTTQLATTAFVMRESAKKANTSHGNHVPTVQTADNYKFLRNDNTWQSVPNASTSQKGVVQLNNNINSTATDQAATASAVKTTYDYASTKATKDVATGSANGLMSAADKAKLDAIANGAGVNQNAYSHFKVGSVTVSADSVTDTIELVAGNGITLTADAATDKITITGVNQYTHPTGDGNLHVPANGTTNNGRFLQATGTAGIYQWSTLPIASTSTVGIVQLGTGAANAAQGNHNHNSSYYTKSEVNTELSKKVKRIDLTGQCQTTSYRHSVIALCETSAVNTSINSYSMGTIYAHRTNGLGGAAFIEVTMECHYSGDHTVNSTVMHNLPSGYAKPCTFSYNGKVYGGLEVYIADAEYSQIFFNGETNFEIFALDFKTVKSGETTVLNEEVNNSIDYTKANNRGILRYNTYKVYHEGLKPTPADIGAAPAEHTHEGLGKDYLPLTGGTLSGPLVILGTAASNPLMTRGIQGSDGNGAMGPLYLNYNSTEPVIINGYKAYHEGFKPTAADIGAAPVSHTHNYLPISGGTLTGKLISKGDQFFYQGASGLDMKNSDIVGANAIVFQDEADGKEGLYFPKAGKSGSSTTETDFDVLKSYQSVLYYNTHKVYHEGHKPTVADIGAAASGHTHNYLPLTGGTVTGNIVATAKIQLGSNTATYLTSNEASMNINSNSNIVIKADADNSTTTEYVHLQSGTGNGLKVLKDKTIVGDDLVIGSQQKSGMRYNESTECIEFYFM